MSELFTALLWLVYAMLITTFLVASMVAVFVFYDLLQARRSSWRRWDAEMRQFQAAHRVTSSQEVK